MKRIFITGIGTGVGKTIVSAIVTEALQADYWKPIQTGSVEGTDSETVEKLITNTKTKIHPESFCLAMPASPNIAAGAEGVTILIKDIKMPSTANDMVIEGAGGLMVPINNRELMIDLVKELQAEVILVSQNYLGSINHTLLSAELLRNHKIPLLGIVFNGEDYKAGEETISTFTKIPVLGKISKEADINTRVISKYADSFRKMLLRNG